MCIYKMQAVLGNRCFCFWTSASLESVVSACMLLWWAIASTVLTATSHTKSNNSKQSWSVAIVVLSWLITVLWGLSWYLVIFPTFLSRASRPGRQKIGASYPHNVNMQSSAPMAPELNGVPSGGAQTTPVRPTAPPATFLMSSNVDQYGHSGTTAMV